MRDEAKLYLHKLRESIQQKKFSTILNSTPLPAVLAGLVLEYADKYYIEMKQERKGVNLQSQEKSSLNSCRLICNGIIILTACAATITTSLKTKELLPMWAYCSLIAMEILVTLFLAKQTYHALNHPSNPQVVEVNQVAVL
jgi:hypothetical protein